jgi:protein SCO1/2
MKRSVFIAILALAVGALVAFGYSRVMPQATGQATVGGPFQLVDMNAKPATETVLKGKWTFVFFGFTHCPDICPTTLALLGDVQDQLGKQGHETSVVFISLDPMRDTPAVLKTYLSSPGLPKNLMGLTGTPEQVAAAAKAYRVYYQKAGSGDDYMIDHSSVIYLMAPDGRLSAILSPDEAIASTVTKASAAIVGNVRL